MFFLNIAPEKKETRINSSVHSQHTSPWKLCFPETIHPFLPEKAEFYKIPLAFFCHSGMLGKYFPFAAGSVLPVTPAAYNFPTARLQQNATFYPTENRFTDRQSLQGVLYNE